MTNWKNLDTLDSYKALKACKGSVDLTTVMAGECRPYEELQRTDGREAYL